MIRSTRPPPPRPSGAGGAQSEPVSRPPPGVPPGAGSPRRPQHYDTAPQARRETPDEMSGQTPDRARTPTGRALSQVRALVTPPVAHSRTGAGPRAEHRTTGIARSGPAGRGEGRAGHVAGPLRLGDGVADGGAEIRGDPLRVRLPEADGPVETGARQQGRALRVEGCQRAHTSQASGTRDMSRDAGMLRLHDVKPCSDIFAVRNSRSYGCVGVYEGAKTRDGADWFT